MSAFYSQKIKFFRDCYRIDSDSKGLFNIFSNQTFYQSKVSVTSNRQPESVHIPAQHADKVLKLMQHYKRENEFYLCRYFLTTQQSTGLDRKNTKKYCCPLLYYPAHLHQVSNGSILRAIPNYRAGKVNPAAQQLLRSLVPDSNRTAQALLDDADRLLDAIIDSAGAQQDIMIDIANQPARRLTTGKPTFVEIIQKAMDEAHQTFLPSIGGDLKWRAERATTAIEYNWDTWLCLTKKVDGIQSVMYELDELANDITGSKPLSVLLHESKPVSKAGGLKNLSLSKGKKQVQVPAILSANQHRAVELSRDERLSLVTGPPGTGKSFTIACMAFSAFTRNESVLVVAPNQNAVNVVRNKMISDFGVDAKLTVIGQRQDLAKEIDKNILTDKQGIKEKIEALSKTRDAVEKELDESCQKIDLLEKEFKKRCNYEVERDTKPKTKPYKRRAERGFRKLISVVKANDSKTLNFLTEDLEEIEELDKNIHDLIIRKMNVISALNRAKASENQRIRNSVRQFYFSLGGRSVKKQQHHHSNVHYDALLNVLPIWFVSIEELSALLPLESELFDLVVIDESTHCNVAQALPALYRGKKATIVGDAKQLSYQASISDKKQRSLYDDRRLTSTSLSYNFRQESLVEYTLSAIDDQQQVYLDEHYRSHPQIINFSNREFYQNRLKVMTEKPGDFQAAVEVVYCQGERVNWLNAAEAEKIITDLREFVDSQHPLPGREAHSIGIMSFFSKQAKLIEQLLFKHFSVNEIRKHDIRVGTPFTFQGDERDVMYISCCIDVNSTIASYHQLNRDDVFNVAITRARDQQKVYLSCRKEEIQKSTLLKKYIDFVDTYLPSKREKESAEIKIRDKFQDDVCQELTALGIRVYKNYRIAGKSLDIIAVHNNMCLAIDLVGYLGNLRDVLPLRRFKLLYRAGLPSFLLPFNEWGEHRDTLIEMLQARLQVSEHSLETTAHIRKVPPADEEEFARKFGVSMQSLINQFSRHSKSRCVSHVLLLLKKYRQYVKLLGEKFHATEITYGRYYDVFSQLVQVNLNNLSQTALTLNLLNSMIEQEQEFAQHPAEEQLDALQNERKNLIEEQQSHLHALMLENESALIQMDRTILKLNQLQTSRGSNLNMQEAEDMLQDITEKLEKYSNI